MTRTERFLKQAEREASKVDYRWRLGSVVAVGPKMLSKGRNKFRHSATVHPHSATRHAEDAATRRVAPKGVEGRNRLRRQTRS